MTTGRERLIEAGLILLSVFAPLCFGSVYAWGSMADACLIFLLLFFSIKTVFLNLPLSRIHLICAGMLYLWLLYQSAFLVPDKADTFDQYVLWIASASLFGVCLALPRAGIIRLFWVLAVLGFLESCYGLWQMAAGVEKVLWQTKTAHLGYATGTYFNRNHFAGLLEILSGIQAGLFLRACHKRLSFQAVVLTLMMAATLMGLMKSGSRSGAVCLIVSAAIYVPLLWRRASASVLVFAYLCVICLLVGAAWGWGTMADRLAELPLQMGSLEGRFLAWKAMFPMLKDYAWEGIGLGNFRWFFPAYQPARLVYFWDHAHNDYIELIAEIGVPAFAMFVFLFVSIYRLIIREMLEKDFSSFALCFGGLTGTTAIILHGLTDFNFAIPANVFCLVLVLGLTVRLLQFDREKIVVRKNREADF